MPSPYIRVELDPLIDEVRSFNGRLNGLRAKIVRNEDAIERCMIDVRMARTALAIRKNVLDDDGPEMPLADRRKLAALLVPEDVAQ